MKVLLAHNRYATRGGEDAVYDQERDLLREHGHDVIEYVKDNLEISGAGKLQLAAQAVWSNRSHREVVELIERHAPDVVHVHNTLPQISPAIYHAAARTGVPVVQTLHNYRLLCPNGLLMRDGRPCEDCVGRVVAWPAVLHRCYRDDRAASSVVVASHVVHRGIGTWRHHVARYIALCEFARGKLLTAGLPRERVVIKPNFAIDRHAGADLRGKRSGALFVGRLSAEKGLGVLLDAWGSLDVPLTLVGRGPLENEVRRRAPRHVEQLGYVDTERLAAALRGASFIVIPSLVYEGFPMVVAEAYAAGLPIIASRLGALAELVEDGRTGLHFSAGDAADLAQKVAYAAAHPERMQEMGRLAREAYERRYTPQANYRRLMQIYADAQREVQSKRESQRKAKWT